MATSACYWLELMLDQSWSAPIFKHPNKKMNVHILFLCVCVCLCVCCQLVGECTCIIPIYETENRTQIILGQPPDLGQDPT